MAQANTSTTGTTSQSGFMGRVRNIASNTAERVRHAASDRAREMADSEVVQGMRTNPIPAVMIGIGIAGAAWMAFSRGRSQRRYRRFYGGRRTDWRTAGAYLEGDNYYRGFSGRTAGDETSGGYTPGLTYGEEDQARRATRP